MSIYSNVTEQDVIILHKLAEQQKEQRALKIEKKILKQTHDINIAESLNAITKKFGNINKSTKKKEMLLKNQHLKLKIIKR